MNTLRKSILIGLTAMSMAALTVTVHADEGRHGSAARSEQMAAKMADHFTKRQAALHDKLKLTAEQETLAKIHAALEAHQLTAEQEPAWATYQAAIKPAGMPAHPDRAAVAAMTAPERMEQHLTMAKQHITTMEGHLAALKTFYATLSAEQKKTFDDNVMGGAHGPRGMMMMRHR